MENQKGYVYILTNPSFRDDWVKIGKSSRPVDIRSKELDNTAVPLPFEIFATVETEKYNELEWQIHRAIDRLTDLRIRQNREFFNIKPEVALGLLRDFCATIDDAKIEEVSSKNEAPTMDSRKGRFKFSMIGVQIGEMITFDPTGVQVKVASDDSIEYEGRIYKLSPFVGTFMPEEKLTPSKSYQGPKYFSYKGEILDDIRKRLGK